MSEAEETKSLLANMDDGNPVDDSSFAAMQQVMGFSSFGGVQKPKRQPKNPGPGKGFGTGANSQPVQPRTASTSSSTPSATPKSKKARQTTPLSATSHPFVPASLPPRSTKPGSNTNTTTPPPAPSTTAQNAAYFQTINPLQATASPSPGKSTPAPAHPSLTPSTQDPTPSTTTPHSQFNPDSYRAPDLDEIAYTHPRTGYTMTRRELQAYERGVVEDVMNNDGTVGQVKVYFKPNFVAENPWEELEGSVGLG